MKAVFPALAFCKLSDKIAGAALKRLDNDRIVVVLEQEVTITFISIENMTDAQ